MYSAASDNQNYIALAKFYKRQIDIGELVGSSYDINYSMPRCCPKPELFGYTALHFAVEKERKDYDCANVKLLLSYGADFTKKNDKGFTPLRLLYELDKHSDSSALIYSTLLSAHCDFENVKNPCCNNGISHFHIACLTGESKVVQFFLKNGVPIDQAIKSGEYAGYTGLHLAVLKKRSGLIKLLLEKGADSNCLNAKGQTPLHVIIEEQLNDFSYEIMLYKDMMEVLLRSTYKYSDSVDHIGLSCLHVYCMAQDSSAQKDCKTLLDADADANASINLDSRFWPGYTPLHVAACHNHETFKFLLRSGANLCAKDANGLTPLNLYLNRLYAPSELKSILNMNEILKFIEFESNEKLKNFIEFLSYNKLNEYLRDNDPNDVILSSNSPLWPGLTLLHLAVNLTQDNTSNVEWLLSNGADPTIQDASGMTALHLAFYTRKEKCIEEILNRHINIPVTAMAFYTGKGKCIEEILNRHINTLVNPVDNNGLSHLLISCITGHKEAVFTFLAICKVDPNVTLKTDVKSLFPELCDLPRIKYPVIKAGSTPLHIVAITSNSWLAKILLENGANPDLRDADDLTWMHRLFGCKNFDFKEILSMPQNLHSNAVAPGGLTHLHVACYFGSEEAVKALLLLHSTADVNRPIRNELKKLLKKFPMDTCLGDTPLHLASRANFVVIVDLLLRNGADIGAKNAEGLNPMHVALINRNDLVIKSLMVHCQRKMWPDEYGLTQLHVACALKDEFMIEKMLESGENVNSQIKEDSPMWPGDTPIHVLIRAGYPIEGDAIRLLLDYIIRDIEGAALDNQPLHESVKHRKWASKNPKLPINFEGLSALHISCMRKDLDIIEKFLKLEVDFDTPKDFLASEDPGFYPLHVAVKYSSDEVVELLLKNKVNIDSLDASGKTGLHLAATSYHEKLIPFLRANESNVTKKNIHGESFMDLFFRETIYHLSYDCALDLLKNHLTKYLDLPTKAKLIARLGTLYKEQNLELLIKNIPIQNDVDDKGRNIFYYIDVEDGWSTSIFSRIAKELIDNGCELDHRDNKGQTALHHAVTSENSEKLKALLSLGADINVMDNNKKTCLGCVIMHWYSTIGMQKILFSHIEKLQLANLYICPSNMDIYRENRSTVQLRRIAPLSSMEEQIITESKSQIFTLRQVLTEGMVMKFPIMPEYQRQAILQCLDSAYLKRVYPHWMPLFNMQRRKAMKRERLHEDASESLRCVLDPRLANHCIDSILILLSTEDWQNVITAVNVK